MGQGGRSPTGRAREHPSSSLSAGRRPPRRPQPGLADLMRSPRDLGKEGAQPTLLVAPPTLNMEAQRGADHGWACPPGVEGASPASDAERPRGGQGAGTGGHRSSPGTPSSSVAIRLWPSVDPGPR
jgi:hypothetical protein